MCRRFSEDAAHEIQAISTAMQRERRFLAIFLRQCPHHRFAHVRRITQDQVVTFAGETIEQIRANQLQASRQLMFTHIAARNREGWGGDVDAIDPCARESMRGDYSEAARSGAEIQYGLRRLARFQPRLQAYLQQFGDV